jgi:hypothetical protein
MDSIIDLKKSNAELDGLLDEIGKQKKIVNQIQSENRTLRTSEIKLKKVSETLKLENTQLSDEIFKLSQRIRELEIELTLPSSERTVVINRNIDPYPKVPTYKKFNWSYVIVPIVALLAVFAGKYWGQRNTQNLISMSSLAAVTPPSVTTTQNSTNTTNIPTSIPATDGYLTIENPLSADGMVRIMDGYGQKARVLAWVNPGDKFKIRAQSPTKMRRVYVKDGENVAYEDYFYKISDKEQWVFGLFTTKRVPVQ